MSRSLAARKKGPSRGQRDVLEPYLAARDLFLSPDDDRLPELLALALDDRLGDHVNPFFIGRRKSVLLFTPTAN
jgi:hypothetical protein